MSRLDKAARSVPAGSSPADDPNLEPVDDQIVEDPEPAGKQSDTDDQPDGEKDGRSIDNVRGELLRKMEKQNSELMAELRAMRDEFGVPSAQPAAPTGTKTIDQMSVAELEAMLPNVPDESKEQFKAYLAERKIDDKVEQRLTQHEQRTTYKQREGEANRQAFERWPQLHDRTSEFYQKADQILADMGDAATSNPRAVLDAANEAGLALGLAPNVGGGRLPRREPGKLAPGRTSSTPGKKTDMKDRPSREHYDDIANRLRDAMPNQKFSKEAMERIMKRDQEVYRDGNNYNIR